MTSRLKMLDEEAFRPFDRDRELGPEAVQVLVELVEPGDVVTDTGLEQSLSVGRENAELVVLTAPVDAGEYRP